MKHAAAAVRSSGRLSSIRNRFKHAWPLCQRIVELDAKLDAIGQADDRVRRLRTIPGVGPRLSELVVSMIDDPHRFKSVRHVSAYGGRYMDAVAA